MRLEKRRYDDVVILKFVGEFDAFNLPTYSRYVDAMIEAGDRRIVLDLHPLKSIDSDALGYLITTNGRVKDAGGEIVIVRPSRYVARTFATLGPDRSFTTYATVEDGILHFKRGQGITRIDLSEGDFDATRTGALPILFRKDDKSALPPSQVGHIVTLFEDGLLFHYRPFAVSGEDPVDAELTEGVRLKLKFRRPFTDKYDYVEILGVITHVIRLADPDGDGPVTSVRVRYERIGGEGV